MNRTGDILGLPARRACNKNPPHIAQPFVMIDLVSVHSWEECCTMIAQPCFHVRSTLCILFTKSVMFIRSL